MRRIQVIILLLLTFSRTIAQSEGEKPFIRFKNLSDDVVSGLSEEKQPNCFFQDSHGFIWIGDITSFKYYDGYSLKEYKLEDVRPKTKDRPFEDMMVTAITEDHLGNIWVFASFNKMYHLDRKTDVITIYTLDNPGIGVSTSVRDFTRCMFEDSKNRLWVSTDDGFKRFDWETKKFISIPYYVKTHKGWLFEDKEGQLWEVLTEGIKSENNIFLPFQNKKGKKQKINSIITKVMQDKSGNLWLSTFNEGLFYFDKNTYLLTQYKHEPQNPNSLLGNDALDIVEDKQGRIWISNDQAGFVIYEPATGQFHRYLPDSRDPDAITNNCGSLFKDKNDGIWLLHFIRGISYIGQSSIKFKNYLANNYDSEGLNYPYINNFFERPNEDIWIATNGGGLYLWHRKHNTFEHFTPDPDNPNSISHYETVQVIEDKAGLVWILTSNGLDRFNYNRKQFKHYQLGGVLALDKEGETWLTHEKGGHKYNRNTETFDLILPDLYGFYAGLYGLYDFFMDKKGNYWVGSPKGFCKYDFASKELTNCISGSFALIRDDSKGNLWMLLGAQGDTLIKYNPSTKIFSDTLIIKNRRDYRGNSMIIDDKDQVWLGTVNGLYRYNPEKKSLKRFDTNDGLASNYMALIQVGLKTSHGELMFASTKGFTIFHPDNIKENSIVPPVIITGFKIKNQEVPVAGSPQDTLTWKSPLKQHIHFTESITLTHDQNDISFEFAALNYENPQKNQYKYILEGYDKDWTATDASLRIAKYTNLSPKRYTFRVIGSNNDGVWNTKGDSLEIIILPPWWRTWWAYLLYIALMSGSIFTLYHYQLNQRLQKAEAKRIKELDAVKTKLYTNITHEFRTPLTVILGMAQQALDKPSEGIPLGKEYFEDGLKMIVRNGQNLLTLVNQMLDLSKLESGKLTLHYQQGDIVTFLKYIAESFQSLAENKGVQMHFFTDEQQLSMDFDEMRLQQVVSNLLSNAIKFTPKGGHINLSIDRQNNTLVFKIKDTGIGIAETDIPYIFDRFYQVDDSHTRHGEGTGIGLALTKELVKLMNGTIAVKSSPNEGTEFEVALPISPLANGKDAKTQVEQIQTIQYKMENLVSADENQALDVPENSDIVQEESYKENPLVLIADDNADVRAYISSCLATDYRLNIAKDGQDCENIAFNTTPDLIVLDVMMPFKDGFEVCKTLKNDERTSHIPIILLTAKADMESKLEGLERGADAYLTKPFHKEELLLRIKKLLELRQQLQKHYLSIANFTEGVGSPITEAALESNSYQVSGLEHVFVIKVKKTIEAHLNDYNFDVEKLSRALALSHSQVHRKLSALTGISPTSFIRYVRLVKAKELLLNSGFSIAAIAYDCGFNDPAYFSRVFKQTFGVTPQAWREQHLL